jgi:hypothetical protein
MPRSNQSKSQDQTKPEHVMNDTVVFPIAVRAAPLFLSQSPHTLFNANLIQDQLFSQTEIENELKTPLFSDFTRPWL